MGLTPHARLDNANRPVFLGEHRAVDVVARIAALDSYFFDPELIDRVPLANVDSFIALAKPVAHRNSRLLVR